MKKQILLFFTLTLFAIIFTEWKLSESNNAMDKPNAAVKASSNESAVLKLSEQEISEIIQAVEDEIYDYGYYKKYWGFGYNAGNSKGRISEIPIYIKPGPDKDGNYWIIYRLLPYGEVYRLVYFGLNGMAILGGDPEIGFPVTQPSHLTIFENDEEICRMKSEWIKKYFHIEDEPTIFFLEKVAERQEKRVGFSNWKYRKSRNSDNKK